MDHVELFRIKVGLAEMLKGGVIMDVMTADQARIAEEAGAVAVMALERIPARIRREGGVARMSDPRLIREIHSELLRGVRGAQKQPGQFRRQQNFIASAGARSIDEATFVPPPVPQMKEALHKLPHGSLSTLAIGTIVSGIVGYASIWFLLRYLRTHTTGVFIGYRLIVGITILVLLFANTISPT